MNKWEKLRQRIAASPEGRAYRRTRRLISFAFFNAARFRQSGDEREAAAWDGKAEALHHRLLLQPWPTLRQSPAIERIVTDHTRTRMNDLVRALPVPEGPPDARTALKLVEMMERAGK